MKSIGIIAEFNPFHNGHAYLIKKAKELTGADYVIVIMSGNYVQRGLPSIISKWERTQAALLAGVDCVFELPPAFSTASAELFAQSAVCFLNNLNCIDYLCFGCEDENIDLLKSIASLLCNEPAEYKTILSENLKAGDSYPLARQKALCSYFSTTFPQKDDVSSLLSSPNNILAIEYLKALTKFNSKIHPMGILRQGSGYNSIDLGDSFASASGIRNSFFSETDITLTKRHLTEDSFNTLNDAYTNNTLISPEDFSDLLGQCLLANTDFQKFYDINEDLSNRINNLKNNFTGISSFTDILLTKNTTYSHISRALMHIILDITKNDIDLYRQMDFLPVGRLLGFHKSSSEILKTMKEKSNVAIISKYAAFYNDSSKNQRYLLDKWLFADSLYRMILMRKSKKYVPTEFESQIIIK